MRHVPHVYVAGPWDTDAIPLTIDVRHHLERVLRRHSGDPVTYTDGAGTAGAGTYQRGSIVRGEEAFADIPDRTVTVAVAPPRSSDRARLIVEKLGELGADRLVWLETDHGSGRIPRSDKADTWAVAALQQSQGDRLLEIAGPLPPSGPWADEAILYVADRAGLPVSEADPSGDAVILIGPEGGFSPNEVPEAAIPLSLGPRILRVETAAIVAAAALVRGR